MPDVFVRGPRRDRHSDHALTLEEGYDHHGVRFARTREGWEARRGNGEVSNYVVVGPVTVMGATYWHVYKRLNGGRLRWIGRRGFDEEAAALVRDDAVGRVRVALGGHSFTPRPTVEVAETAGGARLVLPKRRGP